jgi:uncharacterized protein DUF1592/uncharacterized protein DUF1588/uncharacterized protein DUF1587/uncharacterized protein DUF1585/uncharacterized protein DUF1595
LNLDGVDPDQSDNNAEVLEKVVRKLRGGLMPPAGRPRPDRATYDAVITRLETDLDQAAARHPDVGRTQALHRLNRVEYRNAVRDLLAVDVDVATLLPADDASYGFDNIAGALRVNPSLLERYLTAAQKISRVAVGARLPAPAVDEFAISDATNQDAQAEDMPFGTRGGMRIHYHFQQDGEYVFRARLSCGPPSGIGNCDGSGGFDDEHQLELTVDGERVKLWSIPPRPANASSPDAWQVRVPVKAGSRDVTIAFLKPSEAEETEWLRQRFLRPIYISNNIGLMAAAIYEPSVATLSIAGPYNPTGPGDTPSRRRIFTCQPETPETKIADDRCAKSILLRLARVAYRRPVTDKDVDPLLAFFARNRADGGDFESSIELAIRRLLVSPEFLFRVEHDPEGVAPGTNYRINDLELASRLSFFLWSSVPDEQLLGLAARGRLHDRNVLRAQVRRMLADRRSEALVSNFVGQWLQVRNLEAKRPSEPLFPNFDDSLRNAFRRETELFFESILREDRSVVELLSADYTFINERLALHYGIPNVKGSHFRRVSLPDERRRGILGQGSVLLVTSHAIRTSPVLRGKWILTNILGTPPPDPPANVPPLKETAVGERVTLSVRELMAQHRKNPVCAACHSMIDPAGFALENFDAVGKWRDTDDSGKPIDPTGELPDSTRFNGVTDFRQALTNRPERFVNTITEKLLTYALGRGLTYQDAPYVRKVRNAAATSNYRLSSIIYGIIESDPFLMRRAN